MQFRARRFFVFSKWTSLAVYTIVRFTYKNMEKVQPCNMKKSTTDRFPVPKIFPDVSPPSIASNYYLQKVMDITPFYFHSLYDVFIMTSVWTFYMYILFFIFSISHLYFLRIMISSILKIITILPRFCVLMRHG